MKSHQKKMINYCRGALVKSVFFVCAFQQSQHLSLNNKIWSISKYTAVIYFNSAISSVFATTILHLTKYIFLEK